MPIEGVSLGARSEPRRSSLLPSAARSILIAVVAAVCGAAGYGLALDAIDPRRSPIDEAVQTIEDPQSPENHAALAASMLRRMVNRAIPALRAGSARADRAGAESREGVAQAKELLK